MTTICAPCGLRSGGGFASADRCAIRSCPLRTIECSDGLLVDLAPELVPPVVRSKNGTARHLSDWTGDYALCARETRTQARPETPYSVPPAEKADWCCHCTDIAARFAQIFLLPASHKLRTSDRKGVHRLVSLASMTEDNEILAWFAAVESGTPARLRAEIAGWGRLTGVPGWDRVEEYW